MSVLPTTWRQKSTGIDVEQDYFTVTLCIYCQTILWNINVRKQAINDKLQGSVATCLKYGGVF